MAIGLWALPAYAGKRLALVIGNSQYQNVTKLPNPANDAADIAAKLTELGFEVDSGIDLTQEQFDILISDFRGKIRAEQADDVVFYYAGHAFNLDGLNQFVPVDAKLKDRNLISYETVRLDRILSQIQVSDTQKTVVLLDACRNSPLPPELQDDHVGGGLAQLQTSDSTANALVVFATLPNQVTKDGKGRNSPFARALLQNMGRPGESIDEIFPDIRRQIMAETDGTQKPFKQGSPPELFYFNPDQSIASIEPEKPSDLPPDTGHLAEVVDTTPEALPENGGTLEDGTELKAMRTDDGAVIMGEEVGRPDEPATEPPVVAVEKQPPVIVPEEGKTVAEVPAKGPLTAVRAGSGQAVESVADAGNTLSPSGTEGQLDSTKETADAVAPATGLEIASNGSAPLAPGTRIASIDPEIGTSAVEGSLNRSTIVSAGNGRDEPIDAGRSADLGGVSGRSLLESLSSDVIKGIEVPDDGATAQPDNGASSENGLEQQALLDPNKTLIEPLEPPVETPEEPGPELITGIQAALKEAGCFGGNADGRWGGNSQAALEQYLDIKGIQADDAAPSAEVLVQMQAAADGSPVCVASLTPPEKPVKAEKPERTPKPAKARTPERTQKPIKAQPPAKPQKPAKTQKPSRPTPPVKPPPRKPGPIVIIGG